MIIKRTEKQIEKEIKRLSEDSNYFCEVDYIYNGDFEEKIKTFSSISTKLTLESFIKWLKGKKNEQIS